MSFGRRTWLEIVKHISRTRTESTSLPPSFVSSLASSKIVDSSLKKGLWTQMLADAWGANGALILRGWWTQCADTAIKPSVSPYTLNAASTTSNASLLVHKPNVNSYAKYTINSVYFLDRLELPAESPSQALHFRLEV